MAEELLVEEAAKEVVDLAVETTNTGSGKVVLVIGGALVGFAAGYFFAKRQLAAKYNQMAEDEIAEMRAHYLAKEVASDEKKPLEEVMAEHGYTSKLEGPDETVWVKFSPNAEVEAAVVVENGATEGPEDPHNVFQDYKDDWDYDVEVASRTPDVPYVIHRDEFFNNETPYEQITLTYFEGDDVLADSNDTPVDDQDAMVGLGNLSKFGHGSGDPNIVYIRNLELELEIEIVHSDNAFSEEVHRIPPDDELKHSDRRRRRRRDDD